MATIIPSDIEQFVTNLIEHNRSLYGDARMDATEETGNEPEGQEPKANEPGEGGEGGEQPPAGDKPAEQTEDSLPEWARNELKKVRGEAANYRTRLRDTETRFKDAKTPEEFEAALNEMREANAELERRVTVANLARKYELPDELAVRIKGATEEEMEADAKALQKFVAPPAAPESLGGGLDPNDTDDGDMDPAKLRKVVRRR